MVKDKNVLVILFVALVPISIMLWSIVNSRDYTSVPAPEQESVITADLLAIIYDLKTVQSGLLTPQPLFLATHSPTPPLVTATPTKTPYPACVPGIAKYGEICQPIEPTNVPTPHRTPTPIPTCVSEFPRISNMLPSDRSDIMDIYKPCIWTQE